MTSPTKKIHAIYSSVSKARSFVGGLIQTLLFLRKNHAKAHEIKVLFSKFFNLVHSRLTQCLFFFFLLQVSPSSSCLLLLRTVTFCYITLWEVKKWYCSPLARVRCWRTQPPLSSFLFFFFFLQVQVKSIFLLQQCAMAFSARLYH